MAELFEARRPKDPAVISDIDGMVEYGKDYKAKQRITVIPTEGNPVEYLIPKGRRLVVQDGDIVKKGDMLTDANITIKRSGSGIPAAHWDMIVGTKALHDFDIDEPIRID